VKKPEEHLHGEVLEVVLENDPEEDEDIYDNSLYESWPEVCYPLATKSLAMD